MKAGRIARYVIAALLIIIGIGVFLYPKFTDWRYAWSQRSLEVFGPSTAQTGDRGGIPLPKGVVAKLVVARMELDAYVLEGTDQDVLAKGPGHYEETAMPGQRGNCGFAAHRTMHGAAFRYLDRLKPGDKILVYTTKRKCVYRVFKVTRVDPSDVSVIAPTKDWRLTMTTCNPLGSDRQRLVVAARLIR